MRRIFGPMVVAAVISWSPLALADEIVYFTNGAEMTVLKHTVEKEMVKIDLGGNSFISFPIAMVDKIASAGQDVFLNPVYHPANQAVAGATSAHGALPAPLPNPWMRGGGTPVGYRPGQSPTGAGIAMGEASDYPVPAGGLNSSDQVATGSARRGQRLTTARPQYADLAHPVPPGASIVLDPPGLGQAQPVVRSISARPVELPNASVPPRPKDEGDGSGSTDGSSGSTDGSTDSPPAQDPPEND